MNYIIDAAAGLLIGVLSGMGIGSGGLLVIYLVSVRRLSQLGAQGLNLLFFVFSSAASLFIHRKKRNIDARLTLICALIAVIGSFIGTWTSTVISENTVRHVFALFLIFAGISSAAGLIKKHIKS